MFTLCILAVSAFALCLGITPVFRDIFLKAGLVDKPDKDRKFHARPVPRMGGVPIFVSYAAALALVYFVNPLGGTLYVQHRTLLIALLPAAAVIFATGLMDDLFGLKPWQKLCGQCLGAVLAISLGLRLHSSHLPPWATAILSFVWLIGCSNAVNLIDGMDGLATGITLLATVSTLLVALLSGNVGLALATVPLAGALLAFLRYNFAPASIFLGDCGSLTIGFVLGCLGLAWSERTGTMLGMFAPLMALSLPLIDVALAIGRRFLRSVPIFKGDRGHIHHRVLALGFSTRRAALLLYGVCGISAALSILESFTRRTLLVPLLFTILVVFGVRRLGYVEFAGARSAALRARNSIKDHIYLQELHIALKEANTLERWMEVLCTACIDLKVAAAEVSIDGHVFVESFAHAPLDLTCRIEVELCNRGSLTLTLSNARPAPRILMDVLHQFQSCLKAQAPLISTETAAASARVQEKAA